MTKHEQIRTKRLRQAAQPRMPEERVSRDDIQLFLDLTHDPDPQVRSEAVRTLCPCHVKATNPEVWDRLISMVVDKDADVRRQVFHTLGDGSPREREQEVVQALESMQHDSDLRLRRRVRKLLAQYRRTGRINAL